MNECILFNIVVFDRLSDALEGVFVFFSIFGSSSFRRICMRKMNGCAMDLSVLCESMGVHSATGDKIWMNYGAQYITMRLF